MRRCRGSSTCSRRSALRRCRPRGEAAHRRGVEPPPVTVKMRMGIDVDHLTYLDAGRAAAAAGVTWWRCTGVPRPSCGRRTRRSNGDRPTGCGVAPVAGAGARQRRHLQRRRRGRHDGRNGLRGRRGRARLFGSGRGCSANSPRRCVGSRRRCCPTSARCWPPCAGTWSSSSRCAESIPVRAISASTSPGISKGSVVPHAVRVGLAGVSGLDEFDALVDELDTAQPFPVEVASGPRGALPVVGRSACRRGGCVLRSIDSAGRLTVSQGEGFASGG